MTGGRAGLTAVAIGAAGWLLCLVLDRRTAVQGWTLAVVAWSGVPLGSLVLELAGTLTGGRWRAALRPVVAPASGLTPLVALALLPVLLDLGDVFPWASPAAAGPADVRSLYLAPVLLAIRTAAGLGGLALLGRLANLRASTLAAGVGLAFAALALSVFAVDWVLSVDPGIAFSALPATVIVQQVLTALGACALILPRNLGERDRADLAGMLIAGMLGVFYLALMAFVVAWYGNLPDKAAWYLRRMQDGWTVLLGIGFALGVLCPFLLLLFERARRGATALRMCGAGVLVGAVLHTAWLMGPAFGWSSLPPAALGLVAMAGSSALLAVRQRRRAEAAHA